MQLIIGVVCMAMIANLQYGWTYFVGPMAKANSWDVAGIQVAFSIFVALETWLTPLEGWIVNSLGQRGPKLMVAAGGVFVALGWLINAKASSLEMLYLGAVVSGIGAGGIYATCVGNAVKWFPDRRGLAVGLTAAGFGAGAAVTVIPIQHMIASIGYADTFYWFAIGQGAVIFVLAWVLRPPLPGEVPTGICRQGPAIEDLKHAGPDAFIAGVLAALRHVRAGIRQRLDGGGADRADRQGLWRCPDRDFVRRVHADRCRHHRQSG